MSNPYKKDFNMPAGKTLKTGTVDLSKDKVFDKKGELNAYDDKDALRQIEHIMANKSAFQQDMSKKIAADSNVFSQQEVGQAIQEAFNDPTGEGHAIVGQQLLNPIKEIIDYEGWIRKVLKVRTVGEGEIVRYDKDVHVVGWVVGEDAETPESRVGGRYIYPPEFEVTARPTVLLKDIFQKQYDVLARAQDKARQAIEFSEDNAGINLLRKAASTTNPTTYFANLNLNSLEDLKYQVEKHRLVVDKFLINRREMGDIIKHMSSQVDPVTQREMILAGYVATVLNASIITSAGTGVYEVVNPGEVFACTAPDYLGGMPIRQDLMSEPFSQSVNGKPARGWMYYELISQVIVNPKAVARGEK